MSILAALRRARETRGECAAVLRYRRHKEPFAWCEGLRCNREPGHDGAHGDDMRDGTLNVLYGSVWPDGVDVSEWTDDHEGAVRSPWTDGEVTAWRKA